MQTNDNAITVREIARVTGLSAEVVRKWDGYDMDTDTVLLTDAELDGLWNLANKGNTSRTKRNRLAGLSV